MKRKVLLLGVLIAGLFLFFILKYLNTNSPAIKGPSNTTNEKLPQTEKDCEKINGIWTTGPFGEGPFCNKTYSDAGKICTDSMECLSKQCLANLDSNVGKCAEKYVNYGCFRIMEKNKLSKLSCRD